MVEEVFPRTSQLYDPAVANVDHTLLVFTFDRPPFEPANATRYMVAAEATDVPLTVVVNKSDIVDQATVDAVLGRIQSWGYDAVPVSTVTGQGIPELAALLQNRVAVLAGPSGVGKSSIINAMRVFAAQQQQACGNGEQAMLPWLVEEDEEVVGQGEDEEEDEYWTDEVCWYEEGISWMYGSCVYICLCIHWVQTPTNIYSYYIISI